MKNPLALLKNTKHKKKVTMAKIPNAFVFSFLIIFMANMLVALAILLFENGALAADPKIFATEEKNDLGAYLLNIYNYGIGLIGVLAAIVMMWGGLMWTTAGGDSGRLQEAQAWIFAALSGLVLALSSVMILNLVNPALIKQESIDISTGDGNLGKTTITASQQPQTHQQIISQNVANCTGMRHGSRQHIQCLNTSQATKEAIEAATGCCMKTMDWSIDDCITPYSPGICDKKGHYDYRPNGRCVQGILRVTCE